MRHQMERKSVGDDEDDDSVSVAETTGSITSVD